MAPVRGGRGRRHWFAVPPGVRCRRNGVRGPGVYLLEPKVNRSNKSPMAGPLSGT